MPDHDGLRIAVIGGCQARGLKNWCTALLPGCQAADWHVNVSAAGAPAEIEKHLGYFNLFITQIADGSDTPSLERAALEARFGQTIYLPLFAFPGFHPDITPCGVTKPEFRFVRGPLEQLQSSIVIAAYQLGIAASRVPRLFNSLVYAELGYLGAFDESRAAATSVYAESGYDISGAIDRWLQHGAFMYTNNHPRMRVLGTLAWQALRKAGLQPLDPDAVPEPFDDLAQSVRWPTHEPIARRAGIAAEPLFGRLAAAVDDDAQRWLTLEAFVEASYAAYGDLAPSDFINTEVIAGAVDGLRRLFDAPG